MKKYLIYVMQGEPMCFLHGVMNARALKAAGHEVKLIMEGQSVKLGDHPEVKKIQEEGILAGVCKACSAMLEVLEKNQDLGLPLLEDMNGHAGMAPYVDQGYDVLVF